jgi:hypothetical protein
MDQSEKIDFGEDGNLNISVKHPQSRSFLLNFQSVIDWLTNYGILEESPILPIELYETKVCFMIT